MTGDYSVDDIAAPLREAWYYAAPSRRLRRGQLLGRIMLGEPVLLGRDRDGRVFALRDTCPHRGMPLSAGRFDGCEIECSYHGWRFSADGSCMTIPSLAEGQSFDLALVGVPGYPVREVQGNIWVFFGSDLDAAPGIPTVAGFAADAAPRLTHSVPVAGQFDNAVIGLLDPAHGPFVHRSWWWRTGRNFREKAKSFVPSPFGFTMSRHATSSNSRVYRLLGGAPATEIVFRLPGVRIEDTRAGDHIVCNMTAITPVDAEHVEINHCIYWNIGWLTPLKPLARRFMRHFLAQDRRAMERQQQGLRFEPVLSLVDEADAQIRWYYRLKQEYRRADAERRPFVNPVTPATLRWRS